MIENSNTDLVWQKPLLLPSLNRDRVHLWRANLELTEEEIKQLANLLSADEVDRANRFRFPRHRRRFIVTRGILRQLLGSYLKINPQNLIFTYGEQGKPLLIENMKLDLSLSLPLQFNVSHSQEYALFGFTLDRMIGVDLEYHRPMPDASKIARRFFSAQESKLLDGTAVEQQSQLFFRLWTAKEAYLKAIGKGLADSLASVELAFDCTNSIYLSALKKDPDAIDNWSLYSCAFSPNYSAAIAINAKVSSKNINYWCWYSDLFFPI